MKINHAELFNPNLPAPAPRWNGFPEFNFVGGHNDAGSLPVDLLRAAADRVLARHGSDLATYYLQSGPQGYRPLREYLVQKLKAYSGMDCDPDEILLTSGSLQGMDLVNSLLVRAGDTVIVEESNYGGVFGKLDKLSVNMVTVPVDEEGMNMDALEAALASLKQQDIKPRFIYTIPTVHNPTGTIMTLARRERLLELARASSILVIEDECYADLIWDGQRPAALRGLDNSGLVIHIGSFSKTIAPALRVGYIAADWAVIAQLLSLKTDAGSGALEQMLLSEFCVENFDDHLSKLRVALEKKLDVLIEALEANFGTDAEFEKPPGGIFLWVKLLGEVDTSRLAQVAAAQGVEINPGREWSREQAAGNWIRICYASPTVETIRQGISKLAKISREEFGYPRFVANS
jgi:2-aminoadipate transaminase